MSKNDIGPITDDEVEDILAALDSFGATISQTTSQSPARSSLIRPPLTREEIDGCIILRPDFTASRFA